MVIRTRKIILSQVNIAKVAGVGESGVKANIRFLRNVISKYGDLL
jgi:hypothetical protein